MSNFNFFINVDQCLNMSNFEMFFYKLQSERKFHLTNVQFFHDKGNESLKKAFYDIRNYIDKSAFHIKDYRLIFGMRADRKKKEDIMWNDTILYRLLKICFEMLDAKIFIKSKDSADKSVSVIMLYDAEFTFEENDIEGTYYDITDDIAVLMRDLGVNWQDGITGEELEEKLNMILVYHAEAKNLDPVTERFLKMFLAWQMKHSTHKNIDFEEQRQVDWGEREELEAQFLDFSLVDDEMGKESFQGTNGKYQTTISNQLHTLLEFTRGCIGHYCVFRKEINKNSMSENMLSLLSIVDYISSDFEPEKGETHIGSIETLREQSRQNWKKATNDTGIQKRYGLMIKNYKDRLKVKLKEFDQKMKSLKTGDEVPKYKKPAVLTGSKGILSKNEEEYISVFHHILDEFLKKSVKKSTAEANWKKAYQELKEKLNMLEEDLQIFARDITKKYKLQFENRKEDQANNDMDGKYSQDSITEELEKNTRLKHKLLGLLRKPQMNPSLTFQDQLNMENALDQCNMEITFYIRCYEMIKVWNFMLLFFIGGGIYIVHYGLMQSYSLSNSEMLLAMLLYMATSVVLLLLCWNAPYFYFRRKIRKTLDYLKEQMQVYIIGYFEKAKNFTTYINTINELDALGVHIGKLEKCRKKYEEEIRKHLWHKVQIEEHIRKSGHFDNMVSALSSADIAKCVSEDCELNMDEGVLNNCLYWPQYACKIQEVEK